MRSVVPFQWALRHVWLTLLRQFHLADERFGRKGLLGVERYASHDDVALLCGFGRRGTPCFWAQLIQETGNRVRRAGIAQQDVLASANAQPSQLAADHGAADKCDSCHRVFASEEIE